MRASSGSRIQLRKEVRKDMALIEIDESWEEYDKAEQARLDEMFPVIDAPMVKAQITGYDVKEAGKLGNSIILEWTIVEHPEYTGKTLGMPLPLGGRMKFLTKRFMENMKLSRTGKSLNPDEWMGKMAQLSLSVQTNPETGKKRTQIDAVVAI